MTNEIIIKAIQKINPTAQVSVSGDDINTIVWENGTTPISISDIQAQIPTVEAEIEQEKQDAINKKASGKQKLLDLGLTEEEVKALIGV
jgi:predicted RNA-binding protein with PIN domain